MEKAATSTPPLRVIFVCSGNSARSQMAEALLRAKGGGGFEVHSAGTHPQGVNPLTVKVLAEVGIDISAATSKAVSGYVGQAFDYAVTVCDQARETCPVFPWASRSLHWDFADPAAATGAEAQRLAAFRTTRDLIAARLDIFIRAAAAE
ncbi:MAG: arsenate reductase ArsC [Candidatus Limnocylindrales bacterium]